jgi:hypothetical protein
MVASYWCVGIQDCKLFCAVHVLSFFAFVLRLLPVEVSYCEGKQGQ